MVGAHAEESGDESEDDACEDVYTVATANDDAVYAIGSTPGRLTATSASDYSLGHSESDYTLGQSESDYTFGHSDSVYGLRSGAEDGLYDMAASLNIVPGATSASTDGIYGTATGAEDDTYALATSLDMDGDDGSGGIVYNFISGESDATYDMAASCTDGPLRTRKEELYSTPRSSMVPDEEVYDNNMTPVDLVYDNQSLCTSDAIQAAGGSYECLYDTASPTHNDNGNHPSPHRGPPSLALGGASGSSSTCEDEGLMTDSGALHASSMPRTVRQSADLTGEHCITSLQSVVVLKRNSTVGSFTLASRGVCLEWLCFPLHHMRIWVYSFDENSSHDLHDCLSVLLRLCQSRVNVRSIFAHA